MNLPLHPTTLRLTLALALAACASNSEKAPETIQGVLHEGASIRHSDSDGPDRSIRLTDGDLHVSIDDSTATVQDVTSNGKVAYSQVGDVWTLQFTDGDARWDGETLEIGGAVYELMPGGALVLDASGRTLAGSHLPLFYDIGVVHRTVTTSSPDAQLWFDRGLALSFGFNHEEAVACFDRAAEADPDCAMAYWGKAYALGPNYNSPAPDAGACAIASQALVLAREALDDETPAERALVAALEACFAMPAPDDRGPLDLAYAGAMRRVAAQFPDDADVCALTAEAVMQLRPWGLWSPEGVAAPETPEIRAILEAGLERWPDHPALCHLYIHAMEASPEVARAIPAAQRLEGLTPGLGHLVHMPSHAYVWTGRYDDVIRTNIAACEIDDAFVEERGQENFYTAYRIHNYHFVAYGAMWEGRRELALEYARAIPEQIPPALMEGFGDVFEVFHATPYHVMVRFGMWDELLAEPDPGEDMPATRAVWLYARGVAYAALGRVEDAEREQRAFLAARDAVPETRMLFQNLVSNVLAVADAFLEGEIEYRKGNYDEAFASLRKAVELDEQLNYDEPWGWMEPAEHALGALLTEQKRYDEAIAVYRADLERYPENGWALHGLAECLLATGKPDEARTVRARFDSAWARADVVIPGSCFCKTE